MKSENIEKAYALAKERYAALGVNTDKAIETLEKTPISLHCWQADDVVGFERNVAASGGIMTTGNFPGRARNIDELRQDIDKATSLLAGPMRLNLHETYGDFGGAFVDRDQCGPEHFQSWMEWAKERGMKLDFNSTSFSHPNSGTLALSNPDTAVRDFAWSLRDAFTDGEYDRVDMLYMSFKSVSRHGADMAFHGADKPQFQFQQRRHSTRFFTQSADQVHNVPVLKGQHIVVGQISCGGQAVHQPQQAVIALIQECRFSVQGRIIFPGFGRGELRCRQMQVAQRGPQLGRHIGKQGCQAIFIRFHNAPPFRCRQRQNRIHPSGGLCPPGGLMIAYTAGAGENPGKPCLQHQ